jgi:hypothetical protein
VTAVEVFELAVSCYLRELDDAEYAALVRRVRPPRDQRHPAKRKSRTTNLNNSISL